MLRSRVDTMSMPAGGCTSAGMAGMSASCVETRNAEWAASYRRIAEHPCFDPKASHRFGRMHLAVAPKCNVQCNFCLREYDCVNESRPGVTSQVLGPEQALARVRQVVAKHPNITVIGIAGPGDPLFNEETFTTLSLVKADFPNLLFCLSTNGLLLPDKLDRLLALGVTNLTVTVNTIDPVIGAKIYSFFNYGGKVLRGRRGAELLLDRQLVGIERAVNAGLVVKVNTVLISTVNEADIVNVSRKARELGVYMQNVMPLIPQSRFAHIAAPIKRELAEMRKRCEPSIRQMRHCRQCRADAVGKLGKDLPLSTAKEESASPQSTIMAAPPLSAVGAPKNTSVAVATTGTDGTVDLHFGHATEFSIYEVAQGSGAVAFKGTRALDDSYCQSPECDSGDGREELITQITRLLADCDYVLCRRIGMVPRIRLAKAGIQAVEDCDRIETAIARLLA